MGRDRSKKHGVAVQGAWLPMPLSFLRSTACAELSPHGLKLLVDVLALLGPNATGNGDLSLSPRTMRARGWTSRKTLQSAVAELLEHGLLALTRQGGRTDCSLFACALFPVHCDTAKLDLGVVGSYTTRDWAAHGETAPSEEHPATWRRARKTVLHDPPRNSKAVFGSATEQPCLKKQQKKPELFRHGTKTPVLAGSAVPPRVTFLDKPSTAQQSEQGQGRGKGARAAKKTGETIVAPTTEEQPQAIETLAELWDKVGSRSCWVTRIPTRKDTARAAMAQAVARKRLSRPTPPAVAQDDDGWVRTKDDAQDVGAWGA